MELHNLENLAPWVLEKDRDLEIQDAYHAFVLDKTADKTADRVRELLGDSYKGGWVFTVPSMVAGQCRSGDPQGRAWMRSSSRR